MSYSFHKIGDLTKLPYKSLLLYTIFYTHHYIITISSKFDNKDNTAVRSTRPKQYNTLTRIHEF